MIRRSPKPDEVAARLGLPLVRGLVDHVVTDVGEVIVVEPISLEVGAEVDEAESDAWRDTVLSRVAELVDRIRETREPVALQDWAREQLEGTRFLVRYRLFVRAT